LNIPQAEFGKYSFQDFVFNGDGNLDSLKVSATAGTIVVNDSLQFPSTQISIVASKDVSDINISTSANQTINSASLSASVTHLNDGVKIQFRPSTVVLNEKTWTIENNGELTISKSVVDASEIRISNGEQQITISSIPSELGNSHDIIATLHRVNMGDILPFLFTDPKIQGITSGEVTVEDPLGKIKVYLNAQTEQTRFEEDSIGITSINGYWDNARKKASFNLSSDNKDYLFDINGAVYLADSLNQTIDATIDLQDTRISLIEPYLRSVFSEMDGKAKGKIRISGKVSSPDMTGSAQIFGAGVKVDYTGVYYKLTDPVIAFKPGLIDIGTIEMTDELGNKGQASGTLQHRFFKNMVYNFRASSNKMLVINTNKLDNDIFYGRVIGDVNFAFQGPQSNMKMYVSGTPCRFITHYHSDIYQFKTFRRSGLYRLETVWTGDEYRFIGAG
jgi:autotransporter translocation and assembly factor TamB